MDMEKYANLFAFDPTKRGYVGIERECFLANLEGEIKPLSPQVLAHLGAGKRFGYELSACQLEDRVGPCPIERLADELQRNDETIRSVEQTLAFQRLFCEVAAETMPLDIFPDPTGRYQQITEGMPKEILLAACRVIGTHVHVGMGSRCEALGVYNNLIAHVEELCQLGDGSNGQRLEIYKVMAKHWQPEPYEDWQAFYQAAVSRNFDHDPRQCWDLVRISVHGTIEFRMFGATSNNQTIVGWAERCKALCDQYM